MDYIDKLILKAEELRIGGMTTGQIADELNVSNETIIWLLTNQKIQDNKYMLHDISIDWSFIGSTSNRLKHIAIVLCDIITESMNINKSDIDVVIGISVSGIPIATFIAEELNCELSIYYPKKIKVQKEDTKLIGTFSSNFTDIYNKRCVVVDDVITTGDTLVEVIQKVDENNAKILAIAVLVNKLCDNSIKNIKIASLIKIKSLF